MFFYLNFITYLGFFQVPICNECMVVDHKQPEHCYEKAIDAEKKQRDDLKNLISESKSKVQFCDEAASHLETHLTDLQMQRDNAKSHIEVSILSNILIFLGISIKFVDCKS